MGNKKHEGFTIVELLIVIVVIGILAAIITVAYAGISQQATAARLKSDLDGAYKQLAIDNINGGAYPATTAAANNGQGLKASGGTTYQYTYTSATNSYCLSATDNGIAYNVSSTSNVAASGVCAGQTPPGGGHTFAAITWTAQTSAGSRQWQSAASSSDGTKLVAGDNSAGYLYTSTDSGNTWVARTSLGVGLWASIASSSDGTHLATINTFGTLDIYTSTDSGATWTAQAGSGARNWVSVAMSSDGTKLVAVNQVDTGAGDDMVYTSSDSGVTWTAQAGAGHGDWDAVGMSGDGRTMIASQNVGAISMISTDYGVTWTDTGQGEMRSIAISSDGTKILGGPNGNSVRVSTNSGATWTYKTTIGYRPWYAAAMSSDGTKMIVAPSSGYIYASTDSGATWTQQTSAGSHSWYAAASSADGAKLLCVARGNYIYTGVYN